MSSFPILNNMQIRFFTFDTTSTCITYSQNLSSFLFYSFLLTCTKLYHIWKKIINKFKWSCILHTNCEEGLYSNWSCQKPKGVWINDLWSLSLIIFVIYLLSHVNIRYVQEKSFVPLFDGLELHCLVLWLICLSDFTWENFLVCIPLIVTSWLNKYLHSLSTGSHRDSVIHAILHDIYLVSFQHCVIS